jgi:hypothetical protein
MLPDFQVEIFWCDYNAPGCPPPIEENPTPEEIALAVRQGANQIVRASESRHFLISLGRLPSGDPDPHPEEWVAKRIEWQREMWDWGNFGRGQKPNLVVVSWSSARQEWVKVTFFPSGTLLEEEVLVETPSAEEIQEALGKALAAQG